MGQIVAESVGQTELIARINLDLPSLHSSQVLFGQMMTLPPLHSFPPLHPSPPLHLQVLFSQMMTLPAPRLHPMAFCTLMVELCKVGGAGTLHYVTTHT